MRSVSRLSDAQNDVFPEKHLKFVTDALLVFQQLKTKSAPSELTYSDNNAGLEG